MKLKLRRALLPGVMAALAMLGMTPALSGQEGGKAGKPFVLEACFINQAVGSPFDGTILRIVHPGFSLGTELILKDGRRWQWVGGVRAGYYFNRYNSRALFLLPSIGLRFTLPFGLFAEAGPGLGYLHSFHPGEIWRLNGEGEYEKARDAGKPALMIAGGAGLGFDFSSKAGWPLAVFVRYQSYIQVPDTPQEGTLWQALLQAGARVSF